MVHQSTFILVCALLFISVHLSRAQPKGDIKSVYDLLERVVPGSSKQFDLSFTDNCPPPLRTCYTLSDSNNNKISVTGSTASEITAGIGNYFRNWCNFTIGWPRGGGSNIFSPKTWPVIGSTITKQRIAPWSYIMNVCTHSYSLVWYSWEQWSNFIDWMALNGVNMALAMTGQEEVQYKVFSKLGLADMDIRTWFNGPAFLTWSRGQNEYGSNIAGPLPRSWMQSQWALQKQILARYRSLGITGQLPGFQGNIPWKLAVILGDNNVTQEGDTGWMDSLDPVFGKIADLWMETLIADFGTDHWYQLDGYFNGGTAPWLYGPRQKLSQKKLPKKNLADTTSGQPVRSYQQDGIEPCQFVEQKNAYLAGCFQNCKEFSTVQEAETYCVKYLGCGGITVPLGGKPQLREGTTPLQSPSDETSYYISNSLSCHVIVPDPDWKARGAAAYAGLSRTDNNAIWSFQGWAIIDWDNAGQASSFLGFVDAVPQGKFVVIDMDVSGNGEWKKFNRASFYGAPFIWTTLHDFGGTDGMKGNLETINKIPFDGLPPNGNSTVIGTGYTPEGIDQNPAYYEFMMEANFRASPVQNIAENIITRSLRRYGLSQPVQPVIDAWTLLVASVYSLDLSVQDGTGIPHLPGWDTSHFYPDRSRPTATLCKTYFAWKKLIDASAFVDPNLETFRYDLIDVGREVLARLSTPMSQNFSDAFSAKNLDVDLISKTGRLYIELLLDVDSLVGTDTAFLIGPWLQDAKAWGINTTDCGEKSCISFYEWNARSQLTTWNPTPANANSIPPGPIDYASKHWNGLIKDYYAGRAQLILTQAIQDAKSGNPLNSTAVNKLLAEHAYTWTNDNSLYPVAPVGDAFDMSRNIYEKYSPYFSTCTNNLL